MVEHAILMKIVFGIYAMAVGMEVGAIAVEVDPFKQIIAIVK